MSKLAALKRLGPIQIIFLLLALIPLTGLPAYQFYILERGMQNGLVVLSLVILLGYTGQLSLTATTSMITSLISDMIHLPATS